MIVMLKCLFSRAICLALTVFCAYFPASTADSHLEAENTYTRIAELESTFQAIGGDVYGGYYVEDNVIHVNAIPSRTSDLPMIEQDNVEYHYVKYSLNELHDLQCELTQHMSQLNIQEMYVDIKKNRLYIGMFEADENDKSKLAELIPDINMCVIKDMPYEIVLQ